jgi:single-strand DNA-binding protein
MSSFNRVIMMGNLTRDPDFKNLASGQAVCRLSLASNRQFKNRQSGQTVQEVCFVDVDVWGAQAESCSKFLAKGRPVLVEGRLKLDSWEDSEGKKQSKHSIVADRVTFLNGGAQVEGDDQDVMAAPMTQETKMETISSLKSFAAKRSTGPLKVNTGEISFKDEKAFDEELPF